MFVIFNYKGICYFVNNVWIQFDQFNPSRPPQKSSIVCYILQILVFWKIVEIIRSVYLYMN